VNLFFNKNLFSKLFVVFSYKKIINNFWSTLLFWRINFKNQIK
jgi:hypothetical protein